MRGGLVLVVGPSGAGKDTLLAAARDRLMDNRHFIFPRRMITRPAEAGGENHIEITPEHFTAMFDRGDYALAWQAHGLGYILPADIKTQMQAGKIVVCNASRAALDDALRHFPNCHVIVISATRNVRAHRLASRGRESYEEIQARLDREVSDLPDEISPIMIDNSGHLSNSVADFCDALTGIVIGTDQARRPA